MFSFNKLVVQLLFYTLGLCDEDLRTEVYRRVEQRLCFHRTDTERLIDLFHCNRLADQLSVMAQGAQCPAPYGVLGVRAYFNHDSLCVEVLHARDVIPLDPNGYSDPFVIIELMPRRVRPTHILRNLLSVIQKILCCLLGICALR